MSEIVKAMSLLQSTMQQPWCKDLMMQLGFAPPVHHDQAVQDAKDGKPSSSRPSPTPVPAAAPAGGDPGSKKEPEKEPEKGPEKEPAGGDPGSKKEPEKGPEKDDNAAGKAADKAADKDADTADDPPVPATINSNTHRAAHARLARRMASLGEAECPNMTKLWGGSRKDCCSHVHVGWGGYLFSQKIQL